jgi:TrpR-related protein YerC/YecD
MLLDNLYSAIAGLKDKKEVEKFLNDILTPSELIMIARRLHIAFLLLTGKTIAKVKQILGAGNTTINNVILWLNKGYGGYKTVVRVLQKTTKSKGKVTRKHYEGELNFTFSDLRRRYPAHFWLLNLFLDKDK